VRMAQWLADAHEKNTKFPINKGPGFESWHG
jgi:hypothetical protein